MISMKCILKCKEEKMRIREKKQPSNGGKNTEKYSNECSFNDYKTAIIYYMWL